MDEEMIADESNIQEEINFIETDAEQIVNEMISDFEYALGESLYPSDDRRMFLQAFCYAFADQTVHINEVGRENLLRYANDKKLDALGNDLFMNPRMPSEFSHVTMRFTLSSLQKNAVIIPKGTRVTPDGKLFFATDQDLVFFNGDNELSKEVSATATVAGESHNDFIIGQIDKLVDGNSYVSGVSNTTVSAGGSDIESDDDYRERLRLSPFKFSVAGPANAYKSIAMSSSSEVGDASVYSPSAGVVEIAVIKDDGSVPSLDDEIINIILEACSAKDKRPLTDNVRVIPAVAVNMTIDVDYYVSNDDYSSISSIIEAVDEYKSWQTEKIGRHINPDKLKQLMLNAGASKVDIRNPIYKELQDNQVAVIEETQISMKGSIKV